MSVKGIVLSPLSFQPPRYMGHIANIQRCIEREYAIREGGVKLLHASSNNKQAMEASKGLFVSDAKIIGHMRELQQQQDIMSNNGKNCVRYSDGCLSCGVCFKCGFTI